ncbi:hypothetical protein FRC06_004057 [Ceratobasidium sp. 370]|nr:hypothetical protein FRC06_004057 [Ceratobasidium sp. 370]
MPPVLPPMQPVHRQWAADAVPYKYAPDDRDWDEYVHPRQLPTEHLPKSAPPKSSRASTSKAPSNKRAPAGDAVGPEPPKKRRKDESALAPPSVPMPVPTNSKRPDTHKQPEERVSVPTDLSTLPVSSLVSYLVKHDIIPPIHPSPYTVQPTLAPSILLHPPSHTPPPPPTSSTSLIPERERRRSSRFQEDELNPSAAGDDPITHHVPILTDLDAVHGALAKLVERHWQTKTVREQDTIVGFVWSAQRARERTLLTASSAGHG